MGLVCGMGWCDPGHICECTEPEWTCMVPRGAEDGSRSTRKQRLFPLQKNSLFAASTSHLLSIPECSQGLGKGPGLGTLPILVPAGKGMENEVWSMMGHRTTLHLPAAVLVVRFPCSQDDLPDRERSASISLERRVLGDPHLGSQGSIFHPFTRRSWIVVGGACLVFTSSFWNMQMDHSLESNYSIF